MNTTVVLVGLPGSGKSTVGRNLARRLGLQFRDSDQLIEERLGGTISDYFAAHGEVAFRDLEEDVVREVAGRGDGMVLATGGGAVLRPVNRERLRAAGTVVYLRSSVQELHRRLRTDSTRPLLQGGDPLARLRQLSAERDPLYRETAHFSVDTGRPSVRVVVDTVLAEMVARGLMPSQ